jgi:hypothetical protein
MAFWPHHSVEAVNYRLCNNAQRNSVGAIIVAHNGNATGGVMNRLLTVAILLISTVPMCAQGKHRKAVAIEPLPMCGSFQRPCVFKLLTFQGMKPYCWGCNTALDQARFVAWIKANP